ncbi:velvet factor-domain-containing protein, partial [Lipomyces oligophaga]|uniref:velvet factor-domain-containing protein n=1 Tax=Lipomyces oligophaga TaxID=45792 RepID=UPI0034CE9BDF
DTDGPPDFQNYSAVFEIIQQPDRARSCGNVDRDRRCLDPPPVLKLEVRSRRTGEVDVEYMKRYSWIVQCFIYSANRQNAAGQPGIGVRISLYNSAGRTLVRGNMVTNAQHLDLDIEGHRGPACYFCFPDLSFSTAGFYCLKFQWAWIDHSNPMNGLQVRSMGIMGYQISNTFRVYSAKDFPSMLPMTPLSHALKRNGLWIRGGIQRNRKSRRLQQQQLQQQQQQQQERERDSTDPETARDSGDEK